jgi:signal transduction histidine kinase
VLFDKAKAPVKEISFDKAKIMRILKILLRNADQLSPAETPIEITIKEEDWNGKPALYCSVKDGGIGVAKGDRAKLFQKFFRADDAVRIAPDGVGLGLYIAKKFAEAHGGTLEADATQKKGATFTLILPE